MFESAKVSAVIFVPLVVFVTVTFFFALGYMITVIFRLPSRFALPLSIRLFGLFLVALGFVFLAWLFRYRKPIDIVVSTYVTFVKAVRRVPLGTQLLRTEPLIIVGPYRHVRHPLYFNVFLLLVGWWLLLDYSFLIFSAGLLFLWFKFVVIPFEERELMKIFGGKYEMYAKEVPGIIPFTKRHKTSKPLRKRHV